MPISYDDALTRNIRAARSRARLSQASIVARMRNLGFDQWHRQTLGKVERGERRVLASEVLGLSLALGTSIGGLLGPTADEPLITLPGGQCIDALTILRSIGRTPAGVVRWEDDKPKFDDVAPPAPLASPASLAEHQGTAL